MPIRHAKSLIFKPWGLTDSIDGTNAPPGSMSALVNLVCAPHTLNCFVPRPAALKVGDMASKFTTPTNITALVIFGNVAYGWCSSASFPGKDAPFAYDLVAGSFLTIAGISSALLPNTVATTGDWTPPTVEVFSNACIIFTHPGFTGTPKFGWLDISSFSLNTLTGTTTSGSPVITAVSADPYLDGVEPGQTISGIGIPAGAYVVSTTSAPNTITISANCTANGTPTLTIAGGTPTAPLYGAGNTNKNPMASTPAAVAQYNGRAYFAVGNALVFSDVLRPRQVTNATQALILGDNQAVTALSPTPFTAPLTGGMITALLAFKGVEAVFQITGDSATSNLASAAINGAVGTLAPNTICPTPGGIAYVAPDGVRIIDLTGRCLDPIGGEGDGVRVPFWETPFPSRMCAAYAHNVMRISLEDGSKANQPWDEYWYDFGRRAWTGPHTFAAQLLAAWPNALGADWVAAPQSIPTQLYELSAIPLPNSSYIENGSQLGWTYQTSLLPDNEEEAMNQIVQSTIAMVLSTSQQAVVTALNESGTALRQVVLNGLSTPSGVWGSMIWGTGYWGIQGALRQYALNWPAPIVFKQMALQITGQSGPNFAIGNFYAKYQPLGYMVDPGMQS